MKFIGQVSNSTLEPSFIKNVLQHLHFTVYNIVVYNVGTVSLSGYVISICSILECVCVHIHT